MLDAYIFILSISLHCVSQGFDELLDLATQGDFRHVDMLVKDIYGDRESEYTSLGLSPTIIASSFGKAINYDARCATIVSKIKNKWRTILSKTVLKGNNKIKCM